MGMTDFQAGYHAYHQHQPYDPTRPPEWREGWWEAHTEDFDSYDYDLEGAFDYDYA